eukprot:IDg22454t1
MVSTTAASEAGSQRTTRSMGAAGRDRPWHSSADHTGEAGPSTRA